MAEATCPHCDVLFERLDSRRIFCYDCLPTTGSAGASKAQRAAYYYKRNQLAAFIQSGEHGLCCAPDRKNCPHCGQDFDTRNRLRVFCYKCRPERHPHGSIISARLRSFVETGVHGRCCTPLPDLVECGWCLRPFEPSALSSKFCSKACSVALDSQRASYGHTDRCPLTIAPCELCATPIVARRNRRFCDPCVTLNGASCAIRIVDCVSCGEAYVRHGRGGNAKFCSPRCQRSEHRKRHGRRAMPQSVRLAVMRRDGWVCHLCGKQIPKRPFKNRRQDGTVDHLVPRSKGGSDEMSNLAAAHHGCNSRRNNRGAAQLRLIG